MDAKELGKQPWHPGTTGATKREVFAMAAMQGLLASGIPGENYHLNGQFANAKTAVQYADALLMELAKEHDFERRGEW